MPRFLITGTAPSFGIQQADLDHQVCYDVDGSTRGGKPELQLVVPCRDGDHCVDIREDELTYMVEMMAALKSATEEGYVE